LALVEIRGKAKAWIKLAIPGEFTFRGTDGNGGKGYSLGFEFQFLFREF